MNATIEGVVREPSAFGITCGSPPSMTATQEFVVPEIDPDDLPHCAPSRRGPSGCGHRLVAALVRLRRLAGPFETITRAGRSRRSRSR